ncbi:MAG: class I adenylate-forming enzyme family protein [Candidatus Sulfotelmatobacter sp.]
MIFELLREYAKQEPDRCFLRDASGGVTAQEAFEKAREIASSLLTLNSPRIYFYAADSIHLILSIIASQAIGLEVCVLHRDLKRDEIEAILRRIGKGALIADVPLPVSGIAFYDLGEVAGSHPNQPLSEDFASSGKGAIIILTTGTTGLPKAALHEWERLLAKQGRQATGDHHTWLLAYPLNHFAGIQVLLHVLSNRETLVVSSSRDYGPIIATMIEHGVDSVSATPTFWRMITGRMSPEHQNRLRLRQITVGGEASTADLLERLKSKFPSAAIAQIYATTELGTCFSVKDGLPGFPSSYLDRPVGNVQLRITDEELYVRSPVKMITYMDGSPSPETKEEWVATGDMVERVGTRVLFRGRKTEIINVGGVKVHPLKIEEAVSRVPGISAIRAYGRPNPVTGQIVACDIELEAEAEENIVRAAVQKACSTELNRYEQPRQLTFVARLERHNEKLVRRG